MIGIIDYGSGNVQAIATIYKNLNIDYEVISDKSDLKKPINLFYLELERLMQQCNN